MRINALAAYDIDALASGLQGAQRHTGVIVNLVGKRVRYMFALGCGRGTAPESCEERRHESAFNLATYGNVSSFGGCKTECHFSVTEGASDDALMQSCLGDLF